MMINSIDFVRKLNKPYTRQRQGSFPVFRNAREIAGHWFILPFKISLQPFQNRVNRRTNRAVFQHQW